MTPARRRRPGRSLPFPGLLALTYVIAAAAPALLLGALVVRQVDLALARDAFARAERAVETADVVLTRAASDLSALVDSYAAWPAFAALLESGSLDTISADVLQFLVDQGSVDAARVATAASGAWAAAGDPQLWPALDLAVPAEDVALLLDGRGSVAGGRVTVACTGGEVYLVAVRSVTGTAGTALGTLTFVHRLDARFVADLRRLTGFEVAVLDDAGTVSASSSADLMGEAVAAMPAGTGELLRLDGTVIGRLALPSAVHPDGPPVADLLVATRLEAAQAAVGGLPTLLLGLVAATGAVAALLALLLAAMLRNRLRLIHDGLAAVADGRVPPPGAHDATDDEIARVAAGLDRLVAALDRREVALRRGLEAIASVRPDLPPDETAHALAEAIVSALGVSWARVVDEAGLTLAAAGAAPPQATAAESAVAPMALDEEAPGLLVGIPEAPAWTDGDGAVLEVMALLAGTVLRDAREMHRVAGRADRLDRANRIQRDFLRGVSHNLRSPLATIELAAADLSELADPFVAARADAIRAQGQRLARLVDQVLLLSRLDSGALEVATDPVALAPVARRMVRELALEERVTVSDAASGSIAVADVPAVEQILWVLLDNAARYGGGGDIRVEVLVAEPRLGAPSRMVVAVEDDGPGVPPAERQAIFRRFTRGSTTGGHAGSGLGLGVARGLARAMQGDLRTLSGRAGGARFELLLPRADAGDPEDPGRA